MWFCIENRKKSSQIGKDDICLIFYLLLILWPNIRPHTCRVTNHSHPRKIFQDQRLSQRKSRHIYNICIRTYKTQVLCCTAFIEREHHIYIQPMTYFKNIIVMGQKWHTACRYEAKNPLKVLTGLKRELASQRQKTLQYIGLHAHTRGTVQPKFDRLKV